MAAAQWTLRPQDPPSQPRVIFPTPGLYRQPLLPFVFLGSFPVSFDVLLGPKPCLLFPATWPGQARDRWTLTRLWTPGPGWPQGFGVQAAAGLP